MSDDNDMRLWVDSATEAVSSGASHCQFAIPDGKHTGDVFFITDATNKLLMPFMWNGAAWIHEQPKDKGRPWSEMHRPSQP